MLAIDPRSASLRRDFGERLGQMRKSRGGRSRKEDFYTIAQELFARYALTGEELRDFMSRISRLMKKPKPKSVETPAPHQTSAIEMPRELPEEPTAESLSDIQEEILDEQAIGHPEHTLDIRPRPTTRRYARPWREVDGEILPPE